MDTRTSCCDQRSWASWTPSLGTIRLSQLRRRGASIFTSLIRPSYPPSTRYRSSSCVSCWRRWLRPADHRVSHRPDERRRGGVREDLEHLHEHGGQPGEEVRHVLAGSQPGPAAQEEDPGLGGQERGRQAAGPFLIRSYQSTASEQADLTLGLLLSDRIGGSQHRRSGVGLGLLQGGASQ